MKRKLKNTVESDNRITAKMSDFGKILTFCLGYGLSYLFFHFNKPFIRYMVKKIICWRIALDVTSLTMPSPSPMKKIQKNLKIVKFSI